MTEKIQKIYEILGLEPGKTYNLYSYLYPNKKIAEFSIKDGDCSDYIEYTKIEKDSDLNDLQLGELVGLTTLLGCRYEESKPEYTTEEIMEMVPYKIKSSVTGITYTRFGGYPNAARIS